MFNAGSRSVIQEHYHREATELGLSPSSTMRDQTVRKGEVEGILASVAWFLGRPGAPAAPRLLELGCGNGMLLQELRHHFPAAQMEGLDYSPDMVELANQRNIEGCRVVEGDVRALPQESGSVDVVITERCVINVLEEEGQLQAFREIHRVLKPGGVYVCVEAFTDGLENLNRAKTELGMEPNSAPYHNLWIEKSSWRAGLQGLFEEVPADERAAAGIPPENFLSSHFFISRVLYPAVTKAEITYNSEFVQFFSFLPPMGNYAAIQLHLLRKAG